ncbi:MAG: NAD(P)/FAD-dependent oxidoreductase, partial [Methanomicrobiales archaeon]|nr:NAD(P)/FAD-dependent oxidoreductase [Methanomicrobiales archaeon]
MITGKLAAQVASECVSTGDCSKAALMPYDTGWRASGMGKSLERNYKVKEFFIALDDKRFNVLAESVASVGLAEFSVSALVRELIKRNPKMLFELKALRDALR